MNYKILSKYRMYEIKPWQASKIKVAKEQGLLKELSQVRILERSEDASTFHIIFPEEPNTIAQKVKEIIGGFESTEQ